MSTEDWNAHSFIEALGAEVGGWVQDEAWICADCSVHGRGGRGGLYNHRQQAQHGEHRMTLTYTTDDDGIHLQCECGEDVLLGFSPTPWQVRVAERYHRSGTLKFGFGLGDLDAMALWMGKHRADGELPS